MRNQVRVAVSQLMKTEPNLSQVTYNELHTSLELGSWHVSKAVGTFINTKVIELARQKKYSSELQPFIKDFTAQGRGKLSLGRP